MTTGAPPWNALRRHATLVVLLTSASAALVLPGADSADADIGGGMALLGLATLGLPWSLPLLMSGISTTLGSACWVLVTAVANLLLHRALVGAPTARAYGHGVIELGRRTRNLPAPPSVVWHSLVTPDAPGTRPWLRLLDDEVAPRVLSAVEPGEVVWSSLWPSRPRDEIRLRLTAAGGGTDLEFTLLTPDDAPDASTLGHLRRRLNVLLWADLRYSYGQ